MAEIGIRQNNKLGIRLLMICLWSALFVVGSRAGVTWEEVPTPGCDTCNFVTLHFITPSEGWILSGLTGQNNYVLLRTHNGGATWEIQSIDSKNAYVLERATFHQPQEGHSPADSSWALDDPRLNGHNVGEDNSIDAPARFYHTVDGGISWTLQSGKIVNIEYFGDVVKAKAADRRYLSAIRFANSRFGMAVGILAETRKIGDAEYRKYVNYRGHALLVTQDGGGTWSMHLFGDALPNDKFDSTWGTPWAGRSIALVDGQYIRVPAHGGTFIWFFRSDDGGHSWEAIQGQPRNQTADTFGDKVFFLTPDRGWSWENISGTSITLDGGRTWTSLKPVSGGFLSFASENEGWMLGEIREPPEARKGASGVYQTTDGGEMWQLEFPKEGGRGLSYESPTRTVWMYGSYQMLLRRSGTVTTVVRSQGKLATQWGSLKRPIQE